MRRRGNKTAPTATGAGVPGSAAGWTRAPLPGNYWPAALPGTPAPASVPMASRPALAVSGMAAAAPARPSARCTRSDAPLSSACAPKGAPASGGAGNLTNDGEGRVYAWDPENRLNQANVTSSASPTGFGLVASYQYDALGRRVAKTWGGQTTRYLCAGAQVVEERDSTPIPSQADITGTNKDGSLANASLTPATGGILPTSSNGPVKRVNFQPSNDAAPAGYLKDAGKVYAVRSNAQSYGWNSNLSSSWCVRRNVMPVPEMDTLIHFQKSGSAKKWEYALPNGSYPVIVVAGDPTYRNQTNNLSIENVQVIDPDPSAPQGYEKGDFDGYAVQVTIADGRLTIQQGPGAVNAKICYVEIGAEGTTIDQATQDRLAALIESATTQTAATVQPVTAKRQYVFGSYVDELISYTVGATRYFTHANHLYSIAATTNSAGAVVERYTYDAYGTQTVTNAAGTVTLEQSAVGQTRGFTGYLLDQETGLYHARARQYDSRLGRFIVRDLYRSMEDYVPLAGDGYPVGYNAYHNSYAPNLLDPSGLKPEPPDCDSSTVLCQIKTPDSNGCGPGGWKGKLIPEMPLWMVDFTPPCDNHDKCYATCGTTQEYCDEEFRTDLEAQCWLAFGWAGAAHAMPRDLPVKMNICKGLAATYLAGVKAGGAEFHLKAQKEYCGCCCGPVENTPSSPPW